MTQPFLSAPLPRRETVPVMVGDVQVGGGAPVVVQSMTNTDTADIAGDRRAGRGARPRRLGARAHHRRPRRGRRRRAAHPRRRSRSAASTCRSSATSTTSATRCSTDHPACAEALDKYRINPGNVGFGEKRDRQFATLIELALRYDKPVRIGVNWGSLDQALLTRLMDDNAKPPQPASARAVTREAIVQSALLSAARAEEIGLPRSKIILSAKVSQVQDLVAVYTMLAARSDHALHLGLTEAGMGSKGIVASSAALGILLQQGIGDTIRISLTPEPGGDRTREVTVAQELLQTMGFRAFVPVVAACPGCGRTTSTVFQELAKRIESDLAAAMPVWREKYPGVEALKVAVMGCIVNGPGESKHADIGISLPGTGEQPAAPVFIDGKKAATLRGPTLADDFRKMVAEYVEKRWGGKPLTAEEEGIPVERLTAAGDG